jgi:ABC-type glycerol-3-phosphate transport system substrate-binding protein
MNKMTNTLAAMTVALLGTAGCADTTTPAASVAPTQTSMNYSSQSLGGVGLFSNANLPGATGQAIVPGDHSTIAGDAAATRIQQTEFVSHD